MAKLTWGEIQSLSVHLQTRFYERGIRLPSITEIGELISEWLKLVK